jgi:hypothetical protein
VGANGAIARWSRRLFAGRLPVAKDPPAGDKPVECRLLTNLEVTQHRDYVLDEDRHDKEIMICVYPAESPVQDLDL